MAKWECTQLDSVTAVLFDDVHHNLEEAVEDGAEPLLALGLQGSAHLGEHSSLQACHSNNAES